MDHENSAPKIAIWVRRISNKYTSLNKSLLSSTKLYTMVILNKLQKIFY